MTSKAPTVRIDSVVKGNIDALLDTAVVLFQLRDAANQHDQIVKATMIPLIEAAIDGLRDLLQSMDLDMQDFTKQMTFRQKTVIARAVTYDVTGRNAPNA